MVVHEFVPGLGVPESARLSLALGGVGIVHSTSAPFSIRRDGLATSLDASAGRYVVGGRSSATLELTGSRGTLDQAFVLQAARTPLSTFIGVFVVVLALMIAAYAESFLRTLRKGRRRNNRSAIVGVTVMGALAGATAALVAWVLGLAVPDLLGLVVPAVVGGAAGLVGGLAASKVGARARARARHQANRLVLLARRTTMAVPDPASAPAPAPDPAPTPAPAPAGTT